MNVEHLKLIRLLEIHRRRKMTLAVAAELKSKEDKKTIKGQKSSNSKFFSINK